MKKVLITGGAGFIGSNYVHYHADKYPEDKIVVLDKLTYAGNLPNIKALIDSGKVEFFHLDIGDLEALEKLFKSQNFDLVIHFAAESHVDRSIRDPLAFVHTNVVGSSNLLWCAKKYGNVRYHQVSTDEVYGDLGLDTDDLFREDTPLSPNCPYAASKASADMMVMAFYETFNLPVTITRCSNNYGPFQFTEKVVPYFFKLAAEGKKLPIYGDGKNVRDWLYVIDHCRAIDLVSQSDYVGEVFNVGGNNEKNNLEMASLILSFLGKDKDMIEYVIDRKAHDRRYAIDASKIKDKLGWEPTVKFEDGIKMTFDWYNQNEAWIKENESRLLNFIEK